MYIAEKKKLSVAQSIFAFEILERSVRIPFTSRAVLHSTLQGSFDFVLTTRVWAKAPKNAPSESLS